MKRKRHTPGRVTEYAAPKLVNVRNRIWRLKRDIARIQADPQAIPMPVSQLVAAKRLREGLPVLYRKVEWYEYKLRLAERTLERLIAEQAEKAKGFHYRPLPKHTIQKFKDAAFERAFPARAIAKALAASDPSDWDE